MNLGVSMNDSLLILVMYTLVFGLVLLVEYIRTHTVSTPIIIFVGLWFVVFVLGLFHPFGFVGYSSRAILNIGTGILCFIIGYYFILIFNCHYKFKKQRIIQNEDFELYINYKILLAVAVLSLLGSFISLIYAVFGMARGLSIADLRQSMLGYSDEEYISNPILNAFIVYFASPAKKILIPFAAIFWFQRVHFSFVYITLFSLLSDMFSTGGRVNLLYAIIVLIVVASYYRFKISRRVKKRMIFFISIGVIAIIVVTLLRGSSVVRTLYSYFSIPVPLYSTYSQHLLEDDFISYGGATFYPFFYVFNMIVKCLGGRSEFLDNLVYYVGYPQDTWVGGLFDRGVYNAFSTQFYYFYMDFRIVGIVLFSLLFGIICGQFYYSSFVRRKTYCLPWYLLLVQAMFGSFVIWQLGSTKFFVACVIMLIVRLFSSKQPRGASPEVSAKA